MTTPEVPRPRESGSNSEGAFRKAVHYAAGLHKADVNVGKEHVGEHQIIDGGVSVTVGARRVDGPQTSHQIAIARAEGDLGVGVTYSLSASGEVVVRRDDLRLPTQMSIEPQEAVAVPSGREPSEPLSFAQEEVSDTNLRTLFRSLRRVGESVEIPDDEALSDMHHDQLVALFQTTTDNLTAQVVYTSRWRTVEHEQLTLTTTTTKDGTPLHVKVDKLTAVEGGELPSINERWEFDEDDEPQFSRDNSQTMGLEDERSGAAIVQEPSQSIWRRMQTLGVDYDDAGVQEAASYQVQSGLIVLRSVFSQFARVAAEQNTRVLIDEVPQETETEINQDATTERVFRFAERIHEAGDGPETYTGYYPADANASWELHFTSDNDNNVDVIFSSPDNPVLAEITYRNGGNIEFIASPEVRALMLSEGVSAEQITPHFLAEITGRDFSQFDMDTVGDDSVTESQAIQLLQNLRVLLGDRWPVDIPPPEVNPDADFPHARTPVVNSFKDTVMSLASTPPPNVSGPMEPTFSHTRVVSWDRGGATLQVRTVTAPDGVSTVSVARTTLEMAAHGVNATRQVEINFSDDGSTPTAREITSVDPRSGFQTGEEAQEVIEELMVTRRHQLARFHEEGLPDATQDQVANALAVLEQRAGIDREELHEMEPEEQTELTVFDDPSPTTDELVVTDPDAPTGPIDLHFDVGGDVEGKEEQDGPDDYPRGRRLNGPEDIA